VKAKIFSNRFLSQGGLSAWCALSRYSVLHLIVLSGFWCVCDARVAKSESLTEATKLRYHRASVHEGLVSSKQG
jgi:hypothetical protein